MRVDDNNEGQLDKGISTSAHEVVQAFASAGRALRTYENWQRNPRRQHVPERVMAHRSEAVYRVRSADVRAAVSEHPLKQVRPAQGYGIKAIKDWRPDFAFSHLFHFCLEERGGAFSFEEFRAYSSAEANAELLWGPAKAKIREVVESGFTQAAAQDAMLWRVGLAYYSFVRELYVVARLREAGLDMRAHPLADALFRADAWCGRTVMSLYVKNPAFRDGERGRKPMAREILGDGQDGFEFVELGMEPGREFGVVHLPSDEEISQCEVTIRNALQL